MDTLEVATRGGAALSPGGPVRGGQTQKGREGRNSCGTGGHDPWPGFLPEVWLHVHEATTQPGEAPSRGG